MSDSMKTIVVTGLIGSGKSLACRILEEELGIPVYDSDSSAKALYEIHPRLKSLIVPDIFSKPGHLERLEDAVYPLLLKDFENWKGRMESLGHSAVVFESAVILQKKAFDNFGDFVVLIDAPEHIRIRRALERESADESSLRRRDALQKNQKDNPRVDAVIDNSGAAEELRAKLKELFKRIIQ